MGDETLPREQTLQSLNAETSESKQSTPQKAIPGTPENIAYSEPIARQSNAVIDYDNIPTQFVSSSLKTEDAARPAAPNLETAPVLSEAAPKSVETLATPAPTPAELATTARAEKVATLKNKLENLGRGEEFNFFARKYTSLLNKPAADADFSDLDNNLQKLSDYLESDQKFEITKVGNLQIRMAGLPILEKYYAAWLQSKSGNAKNEGLAKALDLRRQIAQNHPEVSTQIQAIEYNSGSTDQGKKYAYLRLLAGYAPKAETAEYQHLNQYGIDDRLATNDQDTTKAAQQAVQQKSPEQNNPTLWDKLRDKKTPQKAEQDLEKNIQKLPVKAQNGEGKKTEKSDPKNPQQNTPDPFQALWGLANVLKNPTLTPEGESILQSLKTLGNAGLDVSASVAKGVKSLYNTLYNTLTRSVDLPAEEYADFIGKGGTIYVHVLDICPTAKSPNAIAKNESPNDERHKRPLDAKIKVSEQSWREAEKEMNEKFKILDINLKVKVIIDLGGKPLAREQFQNRSKKETQKGFAPEFNVNDSYMVIDNHQNLGNWQQHQLTENNQLGKDWNAFATENLSSGTLGKSAPFQFAALGVSTQIPAYIEQRFIKAGGILEFVDYYAENEQNLKQGIVQTLTSLVEHETGHHKFAHYSNNEGYFNNETKVPSMPRLPQGVNTYVPKPGLTNDERRTTIKKPQFRKDFNAQGIGHISGNLMDVEVKSNHVQAKDNYGYDLYMQNMLQLMHGTASGRDLHTKQRLNELISQRDALWARMRPLAEFDMDLYRQMDNLDLQIEAYYDLNQVYGARFGENGDLKNMPKTK